MRATRVGGGLETATLSDLVRMFLERSVQPLRTDRTLRFCAEQAAKGAEVLPYKAPET
jgi:hypothetical protein